MLLERLSQKCDKMKRYWLLRTNENTNIRPYSLTLILIMLDTRIGLLILYKYIQNIEGKLSMELYISLLNCIACLGIVFFGHIQRDCFGHRLILLRLFFTGRFPFFL